MRRLKFVLVSGSCPPLSDTCSITAVNGGVVTAEHFDTESVSYDYITLQGVKYGQAPQPTPF